MVVVVHVHLSISSVLTNLIKVNSTHNHENEEDSVEISSHKRTMKKEVEKNRRKCIKDVFNECSRNATENARNNVP